MFLICKENKANETHRNIEMEGYLSNNFGISLYISWLLCRLLFSYRRWNQLTSTSSQLCGTVIYFSKSKIPSLNWMFGGHYVIMLNIITISRHFIQNIRTYILSNDFQEAIWGKYCSLKICFTRSSKRFGSASSRRLMSFRVMWEPWGRVGLAITARAQVTSLPSRRSPSPGTCLFWATRSWAKGTCRSECVMQLSYKYSNSNKKYTAFKV